MQTAYQRLYDKMEGRIRQIRAEEFPMLKQCSLCINVCQETIADLRKLYEKNPLKEVLEEIIFFKEVRPKFYSQYIYYVKVFQIEINRPTGSDKVQIHYLEEHLQRLKHFFDINLDFYQYYRSGATHFDEIYFVRGRHDIRLQPDDLALSIDTSFCTPQSYKVSKVFAYELLRIYLNHAVAAVQRSDAPATPTEKKLQWTGPKVSLIELIYALHATGMLNHGMADIKLLTAFFERSFQTELGNVYHVFQEIRMRKKNRSVFIDQLRDRLVQRMDEVDGEY